MTEKAEIPEGVWYMGTDKVIRFGPMRGDNGALVDPTDWALVFAIRQGPEEEEALLELTGTGGGPGFGIFSVVTDEGTERYVDVEVTAEQIEPVGAGDWIAALKRNDMGDRDVLTDVKRVPIRYAATR
jgi:hypothetical protein